MKIKAILILLLLLIFSIHVKLFAQAPPKISCPPAAAYYAKDSINVVTFGASTIEGVNGFSFQQMLTNYFVSCYIGKTVDITNQGIGGQTTAQGLLRLNSAIKNRTGFFVINMGINDAFGIANGKQSIAETEANMRAIISTVLKQKLVPIICTLQYINDTENSNYTAVNKVIYALNKIYRDIAKENMVYLADLNRYIRRDFSLYQDALHPNNRGYRLMSYVIFDAINKAIFENFLQFTVPQNYPNPANNVTFLDIIMPESDKVLIKIYDLMGRNVQTVLDDFLNTGKHTIEINTTKLPPGVYIIKINTDTGLYRSTKKMIVAR